MAGTEINKKRGIRKRREKTVLLELEQLATVNAVILYRCNLVLKCIHCLMVDDGSSEGFALLCFAQVRLARRMGLQVSVLAREAVVAARHPRAVS